MTQVQRSSSRIITRIESQALLAQRLLQSSLISAHVHQAAPLQLLPNILEGIVIMLRVEDLGRHASPIHKVTTPKGARTKYVTSLAPHRHKRSEKPKRAPKPVRHRLKEIIERCYRATKTTGPQASANPPCADAESDESSTRTSHPQHHQHHQSAAAAQQSPQHQTPGP